MDALLHRARRAVRNLRAGNPSREALNAAANIIEALLDERYPLPPVTGTVADDEDVCCCVFAVHDKCPVHGDLRSGRSAGVVCDS